MNRSSKRSTKRNRRVRSSTKRNRRVRSIKRSSKRSSKRSKKGGWGASSSATKDNKPFLPSLLSGGWGEAPGVSI